MLTEIHTLALPHFRQLGFQATETQDWAVHWSVLLPIGFTHSDNNAKSSFLNLKISTNVPNASWLELETGNGHHAAALWVCLSIGMLAALAALRSKRRRKRTAEMLYLQSPEEGVSVRERKESSGWDRPVRNVRDREREGHGMDDVKREPN